MPLPTTPEQRKPAASQPQGDDPIDRWRELAHYAAAAIDLALDCPPSEAHAILIEAVTRLDAGIDELDRGARTA